MSLLLLVGACAHANVDVASETVPANTQQELTALMNGSAEAWNRGDVDAFLTTYKDDARTAFMAPVITYGLADIKARYLRTYFKDGRPAAQLSFGDLKFRQLGAGYVLMTGRWHLADPEGKERQGYYTLIWQKTAGGWKIVHDHSS